MPIRTTPPDRETKNSITKTPYVKTEKQRRLIEQLVKNFTRKTPLTLQQMILNAGYSKRISRSQNLAINSLGVRMGLKEVVKALEREREKILENLDLVRDEAKYGELINGLDKVTKNIQLLTGGATSNVKVYDWGDYDNGKDNNIQSETVDEETPREREKVDSDSSSQKSGEDSGSTESSDKGRSEKGKDEVRVHSTDV